MLRDLNPLIPPLVVATTSPSLGFERKKRGEHQGTTRSGARRQVDGDPGWGVDDVEEVVDELTSKGVTFERYDEGPIVTDEKGIATFDGGARVAYFKDPDNNTLSIAQGPRS